MPSAFERVVRSVVRELDNTRQFTPVDSLGSSSSFRPYSLLHRKPSRSWFWKPRYTCVNMSIKDILEPEAPEPGASGVHSRAGGGHRGLGPAWPPWAFRGFWEKMSRGEWLLAPAWVWPRKLGEDGGPRDSPGLISLQTWSMWAPSSSVMPRTGS